MDAAELNRLVEAGNIKALGAALEAGDIVKEGGRLLTRADYAKYVELVEQSAYWNRIQHVKKIFLNSTYGALLNKFFRFGDPRFGQSTTLSGRVVAKHMGKKASELVDGKYEFGRSMLAGDTDSCYITIDSMIRNADPELRAQFPKDEDLAVAIADMIGEEINASFPEAMAKAFFITPERGRIIQAGREVVATAGLFKNAKKRYALAVYDKEGLRKKSLKIMGMDTQRTDTPRFVQDFLKDMIKLAVEDQRPESEIRDHVNRFRAEFRKRKPWTVGTPVRVSNLKIGSKLRVEFEAGRIANPRLHYAVVAADNTNRYIKFFNEKVMEEIRDGDKVEILELKQDPSKNPLCLDSIAVPVGITHVPKWFQELPFDTATAEKKLVDKKLNNIFGVLKWSLEFVDSGADEVFG